MHTSNQQNEDGNCDPAHEEEQALVDWLEYVTSVPHPESTVEVTESTEVAALVPLEDSCPWCQSDLATRLVTENGVIVHQSFIKRGIKLYNKECDICGRFLRYHTSKDGLLNYNSRIVLTRQFCKWLRCCVENHTAISREISKLEAYTGLTYPPHADIIAAYLQYEALCQHPYEYVCVECGLYPPILVTDVNKKCCFRMSLENITGLDTAADKVNQTEFWRQSEQQIVSGGKLSISVKPSYDKWAPFLGDACLGDEVYNTEHEKVTRPGVTNNHSEDTELELSEDLLIELMSEKKMPDIRRVCRSIKVSDKGMKLECLQCIKEKITDQKYYNKVFTKFAGSSGGVLVATCHHGIVYGVKFLLRGESPHDHVDLLLSLKHQPTLHVSDISNFVSRHGNRRKQNMFHPHGGRFGECSEENLLRANEGSLCLDIPHLDMTNVMYNATADDHSYAGGNNHPLTGSDHHYAGFDRFHQDNSTIVEEQLRRLNTVKQLQGVLNSQVVEELFSLLNRSKYFLTQLKPLNHIFMVRLLLHLGNKRKNLDTLNQIQKTVSLSLKGCGISFGADKRIQVSTINPETAATEGKVKEDGPHDQTTAVDASLHKQKRKVSFASLEKQKRKVSFVLLLKAGLSAFPTIWEEADASNGSIVLARHGSYSLTANDFLSIRGSGWLTDQVIDAYVHLLCRGKTSILHLPIQTTTRVLDGETGTSPHVLQKVKLLDFDTIVGVYLQGGAHWTVVVISMKQGIIKHYDSYGEKQIMMRRILSHWSAFMETRRRMGLDWKECFKISASKDVHRERDSNSCGVFALKFIQKELTGDIMPMPSPSYGRKFIAQRLYEESDLNNIYCKNCGERKWHIGVLQQVRRTFHLGCTSEEMRKYIICFACPFDIED